MGADPGTATLLAALISGGLGLAGGALGGEGQEAEGFSGELDPTRIGSNVLQKLNQGWMKVNEQLERPIVLPSSFVQRLPTFTGGGLPMPIGVTGVDPALTRPELLEFGGSLRGGPHDPAIGTFNLPPVDPATGIPRFPREFPPESYQGWPGGPIGGGEGEGGEEGGGGGEDPGDVLGQFPPSEIPGSGAGVQSVARRSTPGVDLLAQDDRMGFGNDDAMRRQARGAADLLLAAIGG